MHKKQMMDRHNIDVPLGSLQSAWEKVKMWPDPLLTIAVDATSAQLASNLRLGEPKTTVQTIKSSCTVNILTDQVR